MIDDVIGKEVRKGFLKMIILKIIYDKPMHGYDIIHEIEVRTHGHWAPSPGSVYPALEFLMSKGFISMEEIDRKKVYTITAEGKEAIRYIESRRVELILEINGLFGETSEDKP